MLRSSTCLAAAAAGCALLLSSAPAHAGDPGRYYPPSYYGYPLTDFSAGYYGGANYRQYYSYGRGFGVADMPGLVPGPIDSYLYGMKQNAWHRKKDVIYDPVLVPVVPGPNEPVALIDVRVPADADVWLEGQPTKQTGAHRQYVSPTLKPGTPYTYEIKVRWQAEGKAVEETRQVQVTAGGRINVAFPTAALPTPNPLPPIVSGR